MIWEIVQCDKEVFGIVYFYPIDTHKGDVPNSWYTWSGKLGKQESFPFSFFQGRYLDGLGEMPVYQFNVWQEKDSSQSIMKGTWYKALESLHTLETPMGYFVVRKVSSAVADPAWLKRKEKRIQEKLKEVFVIKN